MKRLLAGLLVGLVAACAGPVTTTTTTTAQAPSVKPRLVVVFVIDGLPQRQVVDYRDQLAPDGLARFLDRGAWFADAHYGHSFTVTAAGHATILTGAYPHRTGIIGNEWRNNKTGEEMYCTGDTDHTYIGNPTKKLDGTSPKNLKVETLGDVLRGLNPQSKVIGISGKDRGAILPAGHKGTAYMYQSSTGQFASSTYYMKEHPKWVADFNAAKPADRFFKMQWKPLLPEDAYAKSLPDNQKWYMKGGALPKVMGEGDKPSAPFYADLLRSPYQDELSLDFARAAIAAEGLGQDDVPDILSVSLSGHDYVNHAYSAESRLSHDHLLRLDRLLEAFFRDLDAKIGRDRYVAVLTADHGFMPAPEASMAKGLGGGRYSGAQMVARINKALEPRFGQGPFAYGSARGIVLDRNAIAARGQGFDAVAEATRKLLMAEPQVEVAYTRAELESKSKAGAPFFDAMERTWNSEVSGDVEYVLKPYWMSQSTTAIATHGSPHPYDTNVPILVYGPTWVKAGRREGRVEVVDIAPTLARILGVAAPAASEGKALHARLMPDGAAPATESLERWFGENGWRAFDFQREVWGAYLRGESGLVHSATGSGKTLAAWLGALAEWMEFMWSEPSGVGPLATAVECAHELGI